MPSAGKHSFAGTVRASLALVALLFVVFGVQALFRLPLHRFGIVPRTLAGLPGILFSPFLHADLQHLLANSLPLFVLLILVLSNREYHPLRTLLALWIASGLGTWLIGRGHSVHIGASAIIFGLVAYLIVAGWRIRSWKSALIAIVVALLYGGIFYGVLPRDGAVSWEGHLCGALAGAWLGAQAHPRASTRLH